MAYFKVKGGKKLHGSIAVSSGKNGTVAILCASLMVRGGSVVLKDVDRVTEVLRLLQLFEGIGVKHTWTDNTTLRISIPKKLQIENIDKKLCASMRISLLFLGALAKFEKRYKIYKTGGCNLGKRTVTPHLFALEKYGVSVTSHASYYDVTNKPLKAAHVVMYESGDTTTENAIMGAVLAKGVTTIKMASANYMVQDLCHFLVAAGAKITGIGTTTVTITGVTNLHSVKEYCVTPDPIDAMAFISLAITTNSTLTITGCPIEFLELELEKLLVMGQKFTLNNKRKAKNNKTDLVDIHITPSKLTAPTDKIYGRPFPGLNLDNLPFFIPIATKAKGKTLIHDWAFENRALYGLEFQKLGAKTMLLDVHRLLVEGPTALTGNEIICVPAIRPSMTLLVAAIAAKGESILRNIYPIERAYINLVPRLQAIGVDIQRIEE
ncbi:MAG: UDP-N-acetylglucosamine 1-carboxyvinyltransferase [Candidatus Magasanikbacteria bacterium]|jgi:UDP-N-acetylglucosamine 1-carboxyvinyltransferase|nr:UDP-N-acetylglucosamine 1-carboxyvinyltransferase [Candidatus Magasanikbacteria bacterium]MBT5262509.1 UDP-N-acetylglucosamine 1-carboxyvinyltransferase [Candidatus Magasanikbacteria bacterium]MBT5819997.1 UDP-N-acetylglucosamine 1-carboxyvinyltransferase [Candidatus Magasanikbacteria bacterium]MBT6294722.1 UDP-N-acetylglucosamine 1-carboxyvinyltransferase [Candidatus Magasanikbacteria bacterium]